MAISSNDCKTFLDTAPELAAHRGIWKRLSKTKDADGVARVFGLWPGSWFARVIEGPAGLELTHQGATLGDVAPVRAAKADLVPGLPGPEEGRAAAQKFLDAMLAFGRGSNDDYDSSLAPILGMALTNRMLFAIMGQAIKVDPQGDFEGSGVENAPQYWTAVIVPDDLFNKEKLWSDQELPLDNILEEGSYSPNGTSEWFVRLENASDIYEATRQMLDKGFTWSRELLEGGNEIFESRQKAEYVGWVQSGANLADRPVKTKGVKP